MSTQNKIFIVKLNHIKGTCVVADKPLSSKEFKVLGEQVSNSSGATPTKMGWFRFTNWSTNQEVIVAKFKANTDISTDVVWGEPIDGILHQVVSAK
tara:strand:- start:271 stop:558 length:288 start_codon:yes stop_codon:yes gene_type:complete